MYWPTSRLVYYTHPKPLIYRGKTADLNDGNNHQTPCGKPAQCILSPLELTRPHLSKEKYERCMSSFHGDLGICNHWA